MNHVRALTLLTVQNPWESGGKKTIEIKPVQSTAAIAIGYESVCKDNAQGYGQSCKTKAIS
jgi:hypothetical protein